MPDFEYRCNECGHPTSFLEKWNKQETHYVREVRIGRHWEAPLFVCGQVGSFVFRLLDVSNRDMPAFLMG